MKVARFLVSHELLAELLMFPPDVEVSHVAWNHERLAYEFTVQGNGLPDACNITPAASVPLVCPTYRDADGVAHFHGWGL